MTCSKLKYADVTQLYFQTAYEINTCFIGYGRAAELQLRLLLLKDREPLLEERCTILRKKLEETPNRSIESDLYESIVKPERKNDKATWPNIDDDVIPI